MALFGKQQEQDPETVAGALLIAGLCDDSRRSIEALANAH